MQDRPIRLVLADDHRLVRRGLRLALERRPEFEVVGEASDGRQVVELAHQCAPDVVVMDVSMPRLTGIEATRRLRREAPSVEIVIVSMYATDEMVLSILDAGAKAFVSKDAEETELTRAILSVARGQSYLPEQFAHLESGPFRDNRPRITSPVERLTPREREVLQLIGEGRTGPEVSHDLSISVKTVETHRNNLMRKLDIHNVAGLVRFAIRHGVVTV